MSGKHRRLRRPGGVLLYRYVCAALAVLLLSALPVWFSNQPLHENPGAPSPAEFSTSGQASAPETLSGQDKSPVPIRDAVISPDAETGRVRLLLLIGQDTRDASQRARSDTMILCGFREDGSRLTLISFLRDLYVRIPGHSDGRLNTAYALGGIPLLKQTFRENFGIDVDGCIEVDFDRFTQLVDLLDGISLELRQDEAEVITAACGIPLEAGVQQLNGQQALAYVRIRNLDADSDFSRTLRQRKFLHALLEQCRDSSALTLLRFAGESLPLLSTDLSKRALITLLSEVLPILGQLQVDSLRIPADGTFREETVAGMAVLVADEAKTREYLREVLGTQ